MAAIITNWQDTVIAYYSTSKDFISKPISDSAPNGWGSPFDPPPGVPGGPDPYVIFHPKKSEPQNFTVERGFNLEYGLLIGKEKKRFYLGITRYQIPVCATCGIILRGRI